MMREMNVMSRFFFSVLLVFLVTTVNAKNLSDYLPNERNTIEIFQKSAPKIVFVHRLKTVMGHDYQRMHVPTGAGSGIVWDNKGHIVTNYHVIKGAEDLAVSFGKITVKARVIGVEPRKDIAVLAIKSPKALKLINKIKPFNVLGSKELLVGQKAIAIGNPYGLDHTLTTGVISALGRQVPGIGGVTIRDMIQTDASINPGNSGGPLLDSSGNLIGMNTAIFSRSGSSAGIGFAVPADDIQRIVNQIIKNGRVVLAGIGIQRVSELSASRLGIKRGVLIAETIKHSPAAKAGLHGTYRDGWGRIHLGDVIVALNGHPVDDYDDLYNLLSDVKVGDSVTLSIKRGKKSLRVKVKTIDIGKY